MPTHTPPKNYASVHRQMINNDVEEDEMVDYDVSSVSTEATGLTQGPYGVYGYNREDYIPLKKTLVTNYNEKEDNDDEKQDLETVEDVVDGDKEDDNLFSEENEEVVEESDKC